MNKDKPKLLQDKFFEEFELVNADGNRQYAGISEKNVEAKQYSVISKTGRKTNIWRVYNQEGYHIASIDLYGNIKLTDNYIEILKNEKSVDGSVGKRYLLALVPEKDRHNGKEFDEITMRKVSQIAKIKMEERIKEQEDKTFDIEANESRQFGQTRNSASNNTKSQQISTKNISQVQKTKKMEQQLDLPAGDIEACTLIKDKRLYDNIPEARNASGLSMLAYSKSKNEYIIVTQDENGNFTKIDSVRPSRSTLETTKEVSKNKINDGAVSNIMTVKGNTDVAYSARIQPGTREIKLQELRVEQEGYIASELTTQMQKPTQKEIDALSTKTNADMSDELNEIKAYEQEGVKVTEIHELTQKDREINEILTIDEIKEKIKNEPENVQEQVLNEIRGKDAKELTKANVNEIIEEKQQEKETEEEKTPYSDIRPPVY